MHVSNTDKEVEQVWLRATLSGLTHKRHRFQISGIAFNVSSTVSVSSQSPQYTETEF